MRIEHDMDIDHYGIAPRGRLRPRHVKAITRAQIRREGGHGPAVVVQVGDGGRSQREAETAEDVRVPARDSGWMEPVGVATPGMHVDAALGAGIMGAAIAVLIWLPSVVRSLTG
jgi:hypothetical protein